MMKSVLTNLGLFLCCFILWPTLGQSQHSVVFDVFHGQNPKVVETYNELFGNDIGVSFVVNNRQLAPDGLKGKKALVVFSPQKEFTSEEVAAVNSYLKSGGSLLLIFDEERRTPLARTRVNELIIPFGLELTADAPVRHNCGAVAEESEVCEVRRELPYSGGRSVKGGTVISRVNDEGDYVHSAYVTTPAKGKVIVMSDGMAGLLMGGPDGERFSGTGPSDSKYWGKDSQLFMKDIFTLLLRK